MNWITEEQVKQAAKQGAIPALRCSLEHHQQGRDAEKFELIEAIRERVFDLQRHFCACCELESEDYIICKNCPLKGGNERASSCCNDLWLKADDHFHELKKDYSNANFEAFQKAESEVCKYIEEVLAKEIAKEEAEKKVEKKKEVEFGDKVAANDGSIRIALYDNKSTLRAYDEHGNSRGRANGSQYEKVENSNIFDDLERNSEKLEKFTVSGGYVNYGFFAKIDDTVIRIRTDDGDYLAYTVDEATEIHQKLGQLIATARRRNGKG